MKARLPEKYIDLLINLFHIDDAVVVRNYPNTDVTGYYLSEMSGDFYVHGGLVHVNGTKINRRIIERLSDMGLVDLNSLESTIKNVSINKNGIDHIGSYHIDDVIERGLSGAAAMFILINGIIREYDYRTVSTTTIMKKFYQRYRDILITRGLDPVTISEAMTLIKTSHIKRIMRLCNKYNLNNMTLYDHKKVVSNLKTKKEFIDFQTSVLMSESLESNKSRCAVSLPGKNYARSINAESKNDGTICLNEGNSVTDDLYDGDTKKGISHLNIIVNNLSDRKITTTVTDKHVVLNNDTGIFEYAERCVTRYVIAPKESVRVVSKVVSLGHYVETIVN